MAFLDHLGKKVGELTQTAAKKSGELIEVSKLKLSINSEEEKINQAYIQIGKLLYEKYAAGSEVGQEYVTFLESITASKAVIKDLKEKSMEIMNVKVCTNCGSEMDRDAAFCGRCGAKQASTDASSGNIKTCPGCGAPLSPDSPFCSSCGAKVGE